MKRKFLSAVLLSTALVFGPACGEEEEEESADAEACEHLAEGPSTAVTATVVATDAPAVKDDHRRYDIALVDVTGGKGGTVKFAAAEAGDYIIFTSASVAVSIQDANGQTVTPEASTDRSSECTDVKGRHTVPMKVGTHTITFGPTPETAVSVVIEHGEHDHEE